MATSQSEERQGARVTVKYEEFFEFANTSTDCLAKCKLCLPGHKPYKYTPSSKGNLLKHLQTSHAKRLHDHKEQRSKQLSSTESTQLTLGKDGSVARPPFRCQDKIVTSVVKNLCGHGGLPLSIVEQEWFRKFMRDVEPRFQPISRVLVSSKLDALYEEEKRSLLDEVLKSDVDKPSVTLDFWTGCDSRSFMGCTVHYIHELQLKSHMLFFVEVPPPHTSDHIKVRFEDELDKYGISCFMVVTDNAANMKSAFQMASDGDDIEHYDDDDDDSSSALTQWTPHQLKFEGWMGCAAHQIQLVVHDGYKELNGYRRVQAAFSKAKAICAYSHKSSHFAYALASKIPAPNDTRWNSHLKLHEHIVKHCDVINNALEKVDRNDLIISRADREILSLVVDVMQYFSEATNILQREGMPTCNRVIPVIDSLENALNQTSRDNAAINALCERLLSSLSERFQYLHDSKVHLAATALDPRIKLSFTDHRKEGKMFVFPSSDVKQSVKFLLPSHTVEPRPIPSTSAGNAEQPSSKKPRLLDFCSISDDDNHANLNDVEIELENYYVQPRVDEGPVKFWTHRKQTPLSKLALQLLSIPCSSAPVERLFSKAGIVLSQRRTRTSSTKLEKLIFLK